MKTSCRVEENRFWSSFSREGIHSWSLLPLQTRTPCLTSFLFLSHSYVVIQVFWDHTTVTTTLCFVSCPRANHEVIWWVLKQLQIMFVTEFTDCRVWKIFFIGKNCLPYSGCKKTLSYCNVINHFTKSWLYFMQSREICFLLSCTSDLKYTALNGHNLFVILMF